MIMYQPLVDRLRGPLSALVAKARHRLGPGHLVLGYHDVLAPGGPSVEMSVGADDLARQIAQVRAAGYTIVTVDQLVDALGTSDGPPLAAITFDDALGGLYSYGMPVLAEMSAPATVFVVADHLGVVPPWWEGMPPTMTAPQLGEWVAAGHTVGSHTRTHRSLPSLTDPELASELSEARVKLRNLLRSVGADQSVDLLAYPSGHHNPWVRVGAELAGYRAAFTFLNGRVMPGDDPLRLPRITMGDHSTARRFDYHLHRAADSWPDHQLDRVG